MSGSSDTDWGCSLLVVGALMFAAYSCSDNEAEDLADTYDVSEEAAQSYLDDADGDVEAAEDAILAERLVPDFTSSNMGDDYTLDELPSYPSSYSGYSDEEENRDPFDEDAAREAAEDDLALDSYDYSYGCTVDCSGHEAGWKWRAENGYPTYGSNEYGRSQSFAEGARAYEEAVEERVEEMRDDYDNDYIYE